MILHQLIHSLDSGEKRRFRLSLRYELEHSPVLDLYEAYESTETFDIEEIKRKTKPSTRKYFSAYKYQLKNKIIASLTEDPDNSGPQLKVNQLLSEIEVLYHKKLLTLCKKRIKAAEQLATKYDLNEDLLKVFKWKNLPALNDGYFSESQIEDLKRKTEDIVTKIERDNKAWVDAHQFVAKRNKYRKTRSEDDRYEIETFARNKLEATDINYGFMGLVNHHNTLSLIHEFYEDQQLSYQERKSIGELYELHPEQIELNPIRFLDMYFNYTIACAKTKNYEEGLAACASIENSPEKYGFKRTAQVKSRIFEYSNSMRIVLLIHSGRYEEIDLLDKICQDFEENEQYIRPFTRYVLMYFISYYNFINGRHKQSQLWLKKLYSIKSDDEPEILNSARLFELILYIEMDEIDTVASRLRSNRKRFEKTSKLLNIENLVTRIASQYVRDSPSKSDWKNWLQEFDSLELTEKDQAILYTFNLRSWLQARVNGIAFMESLKLVS